MWCRAVLLSALVFLGACGGKVLRPAPEDEVGAAFGLDEAIPVERANLLTAIDQSLIYLRSKRAGRDYDRLSLPEEFTRERVKESLLLLRTVVLTARDARSLRAEILRRFRFYRYGKDVLFTGYFQPIYRASRERTPEFPYPIFRSPTWLRDRNPSREEIEGRDGLGTELVRGKELAYLSDRFDAYLLQVQGSGQLVFSDGTTLGVGFSGATDHPYVGVGAELVRDGKMPSGTVTLHTLREFFHAHPEYLSEYLLRNDRFVFFKERAVAIGSLGAPVTANRSIAADRTLAPPGAAALIVAPLPVRDGSGRVRERGVSRFVLDQDTGSAIRGANRIDIFMGSGEEAGERAGMTRAYGKLYYLLAE